jgi:hypothetical protein
MTEDDTWAHERRILLKIKNHQELTASEQTAQKICNLWTINRKQVENPSETFTFHLPSNKKTAPSLDGAVL